MKKEKISISTTKRGFPAMWESGGGLTSGGSATIIAGRNGESCHPVYIPRGGHLACESHALICVCEGYYIIHTRVSHGVRSSATIQRITSTSVKDIDGERWEASAEVEEINVFSLGEWNTPLEEKFAKAVEAGFGKASCYHCRSAFYIDTTEKKSEVSVYEKKRREEEMRRQDENRANLRQAKADREAKEKAEAEAMSKAAKEAGLGARIEAVSSRYVTFGYQPIEIGEFYFKSSWQNQLYTEESVSSLERSVSNLEKEKIEKDCKQNLRNQFHPKFEVFKSRVEALGFEISYFTDGQCVRLTKGCCTVSGSGQFSFSEEGLISFNSYIEKREDEILEEKKKAEAYAIYLKKKAEASALELPTNIRIWKRRGGATNAGEGWVIRPNGTFREPDKMECPRPRYSDEGYQNWEQVLVGEVVLHWSKGCSAGEHHFEVIYQPETLTSAQLEKIAMLEEEIAIEWDGRVGLASGIPSPPVGDGWGLTEKNNSYVQKVNHEHEESDIFEIETEIEVEEESDREITLEDLKKLQGKFRK
ncbi:MAG: hypothetical protein WCI93_02645 [bacterium]